MIDPHRGRGRLASILVIAALLTGLVAWMLFLTGAVVLIWQQVIA